MNKTELFDKIVKRLYMENNSIYETFSDDNTLLIKNKEKDSIFKVIFYSYHGHHKTDINVSIECIIRRGYTQSELSSTFKVSEESIEKIIDFIFFVE